eukprot:Nitzschia sp. Nitz4//scaffold51_size120721//93135//94421//NITZ4_003742-RA/size120721-processed-gene-0.163-mRNA-1//-1//CDS//3329553907//2605//frame0
MESNNTTTDESLSDGQEMLLSLVYTSSSILSLVGSSTIVSKVVRNLWRATPYDRLVLGLSVCDIFGSIGYALYPYMGPRETSIRVWAAGTKGTCSFMGFLTQFGFAAVLYNGFLSIYYLLIRVTRRVFAQRYEPWMHAIPILFALGTGTLGASAGWFSEVQVGLGCWLNDYPPGCIDDCISDELGWAYGGIPIFFTLMSLIVCHTLIFLYVRQEFRKANVVDSERLKRQRRYRQEVATQGLFYVFNWFFCFWSPTAVRIIESFSLNLQEKDIYWLLLCQATALPLQGFLNMLVYIRPNYKRVRTAFPDLGVIAAFQRACLDSQIPKISETSRKAPVIQSPFEQHNSFKKPSSKRPPSNLPSIPEVHGEDDESEGKVSEEYSTEKAANASATEFVDNPPLPIPPVSFTYKLKAPARLHQSSEDSMM